MKEIMEEIKEAIDNYRLWHIIKRLTYMLCLELRFKYITGKQLKEKYNGGKIPSYILIREKGFKNFFFTKFGGRPYDNNPKYLYCNDFLNHNHDGCLADCYKMNSEEFDKTVFKVLREEY